MVALEVADQLMPPSFVLNSVPWAPTAQPSAASMNFTSSRSASTFERCANQVRPPSVVAKTRPAVPTAQPKLFPTKLAEVKRMPAPSRTLPVFQEAPASLVCRLSRLRAAWEQWSKRTMCALPPASK